MPEVNLTEAQIQARLIRRADFVSNPMAFIDCKTPGSHLKQNYAMIGPGVTTSTEQVVNLREPHGFNIGAAAMPHGIVNNLHLHFTAEVFMCFGGTYRLRWGADAAGEFTIHDGDIASMPTWIFRGFVNDGPDDGILFTTLGGDNTGGIIWHPDIIRGAAEYGLYLSRDNKLIEADDAPAPDELIRPITPAEIAALKQWSAAEMRTRIVTKADRRYSADALLDSALPGHASELAPVIGFGIGQDAGRAVPPVANPHGFSMEWLRLAPGQSVSLFRIPEKQVFMLHRGAASIGMSRQPTELAMTPWDIVSVPGNVWRTVRNTGTEPAELLVITAGDQRKRPEFAEETIAAAALAGRALDADGFIAPAHLLPVYEVAA